MPFTHLPNQSRSSYVEMGKRALILLAVLMAVSIIAISNYNSGEKSGRVVLSGSEEKEKSQAVMVNPRYYGVDKKNRPFTVRASEATQQDAQNVALTNVAADILLEDTKWLAVTADQGNIVKQGEEILLKNNVYMFYEGGYEFRSNYAMIRPDTGYATGNQPIEGQGPSGTLQANNFEVLDYGDKLIFRQNVKMTLYLD